MSEVKQYAQRDIMALDETGNHYIRHVDHMTREKLHSKSDIAAELGWRDMQIAELKAQRDALAAENAAMKSPEIQEFLRLVECMTGDHRDSNYGDAHEWIRHIVEQQDKYEERFGDSPWGLVKGSKYLATDAYLNSVRADAIESVVDALASSGALTVGDSIVEVVKLAEGLRAGKDGE